MKIVKMFSRSIISFSDLPPKACFIRPEDEEVEVYMKTTFYNSVDRNAVNLSTGTAYNFNHNEDVIRVYATLIISDREEDEE